MYAEILLTAEFSIDVQQQLRVLGIVSIAHNEVVLHTLTHIHLSVVV